MGSSHAVPVGAVGLVTGRVSEGAAGEVMVAIRGGTEAFFAWPAFPGDVLEAGAQVRVLDMCPRGRSASWRPDARRSSPEGPGGGCGVGRDAHPGPPATIEQSQPRG